MLASRTAPPDSVVQINTADAEPTNLESVASPTLDATFRPPPGGYAPLTTSAPVVVGSISGKVFFKGTPPAEIKITMDAVCGRLYPTPVTTRHYVVGPEGGLANVFVYIKTGLESRRFPRPQDTPVLDQVVCLYEPFTMGVMTGQKFNVRNSDPFLHNVHSTPRVGGNLERNLAQHGNGNEIAFIFTKPEVLVRFKCDVHPWMFAYVGVVDHPFFAVTDKEGSFTITNVPSGDYVLEAYHLKTHGTNPGLMQELTIKKGQGAVADFTIQLPAQERSSQ